MLPEHKCAVIYGAGGAIGGAVAHAFAREGARLFLTGRTLAKLEAVAGDISADRSRRKTCGGSSTISGLREPMLAHSQWVVRSRCALPWPIQTEWLPGSHLVNTAADSRGIPGHPPVCRVFVESGRSGGLYHQRARLFAPDRLIGFQDVETIIMRRRRLTDTL
jgi:NAD(P)-dependent dehydrogenase (short-subunit alcohol dehydrogenase family)